MTPNTIPTVCYEIDFCRKSNVTLRRSDSEIRNDPSGWMDLEAASKVVFWQRTLAFLSMAFIYKEGSAKGQNNLPLFSVAMSPSSLILSWSVYCHFSSQRCTERPISVTISKSRWPACRWKDINKICCHVWVSFGEVVQKAVALWLLQPCPPTQDWAKTFLVVCEWTEGI